jgi:hypothetical protein
MRSLISPATLAAALMVGGLDGCGGGQPDLTVTSIGNHQVYRQPFTQAYASWRNGDLEIVLADDAAVQITAWAIPRRSRMPRCIGMSWAIRLAGRAICWNTPGRHTSRSAETPILRRSPFKTLR